MAALPLSVLKYRHCVFHSSSEVFSLSNRHRKEEPPARRYWVFLGRDLRPHNILQSSQHQEGYRGISILPSSKVRSSSDKDSALETFTLL